jgi:cyclic beta-1,2-glucan synthetase
LRYRYRETCYHIAVRRIQMNGDEKPAAASLTVDGVVQEGNFIRLVDDRQEHRVEVRVDPIAMFATEQTGLEARG